MFLAPGTGGGSVGGGLGLVPVLGCGRVRAVAEPRVSVVPGCCSGGKCCCLWLLVVLWDQSLQVAEGSSHDRAAPGWLLSTPSACTQQALPWLLRRGPPWLFWAPPETVSALFDVWHWAWLNCT